MKTKRRYRHPKHNPQMPNCPLCGKQLVCQDLSRIDPVYWCPTQLFFQGGKAKFHFVQDLAAKSSVSIVLPYRLTTYQNESVIAIHIPPDHPKATPAYQDGRWLFKNICKTPPIQPINESALLKKLKTLVLFS